MWVTEVKKYGQNVNFEITDRQLINKSNHRWIKCIFPLNKWKWDYDCLEYMHVDASAQTPVLNQVRFLSIIFACMIKFHRI